MLRHAEVAVWVGLHPAPIRAAPEPAVCGAQQVLLQKLVNEASSTLRCDVGAAFVEAQLLVGARTQRR